MDLIINEVDLTSETYSVTFRSDAKEETITEALPRCSKGDLYTPAMLVAHAQARVPIWLALMAGDAPASVSEINPDYSGVVGVEFSNVDFTDPSRFYPKYSRTVHQGVEINL